MERTSAERVNDPLLGRVLDGRYRIGSRIARGGMATVYEATDLRLDRVVAVKVMHAGLGSGSPSEADEFSRRFLREAQAAARLSHPNVVAVFDQGDDDGTRYLVMENVRGTTLRDLIRTDAPMSPVRALTMIEPVLAALAAAHAAGMIHRDVKPENVLLADDGRVKVADFGLARAVNAETQHTGTGVLIGTVSYLSPELVVAGHADARADVYAAGVIVYEMLTGQKPHQADSPIQVAYMHVHEDIPAPSDLVPGLPAYVDALVARATVRDSALRPADAGVLLHQVRRVRSALEAGIAEDEQLTADLAPHPLAVDPFEDTDDQLPKAIVDPSDVDTASWSEVFDDGEGAWEDEPSFLESAYDDQDDRDQVYDQEQEPTTHVATQSPAFVPPPAPVRPAPAAYRPTPPTGVAPTPPPAKRSRRGPLLLLLVLLLAVAIGVGGWYVGFGRFTSTPGVLGLTEAQAREKVQGAGLTFDVNGEGYSETVEKGGVLSTDPKAGARISKDGTVTAVISRGPERHDVPALRGRTLDQAQQLLGDAKLTYGQAVRRYDETVRKGRVVSSAPKAGTPLRRDAAVDVVVSRGPKPIKVPDFTGESADAATTALEKLGLTVVSTESYDEKVADGDVIKQEPTDGTLFKGDTVTLEVSKGPPLVVVPRVTAMGVAQATQVLEDAGFVVRTRESRNYVGFDIVLRQKPTAQDKAPKGSTVVLTLF